MSYSVFRGAPQVSETVHVYEGGVLVRAVTTAEAEWTDLDRGLLLALLAEQRETCQLCGHQMSECRDPRTARTWQIKEEICQPSVILQATQDNMAESKTKRRGVVLMTKRTTT